MSVNELLLIEFDEEMKTNRTPLGRAQMHRSFAALRMTIRTYGDDFRVPRLALVIQRLQSQKPRRVSEFFFNPKQLVVLCDPIRSRR
jgi:hypothetical protein